MTASRTILLAAAIAAPVVFVAGQALLPALPRDADAALPLMVELRDQLMASRLLTATGAVLFVATLATIARLGARATRLGAAIAAVGTFFNAVSQVVQGYATWAASAPGLNHTATMPIVLEIESGWPAFAVSYWSVPIFGVGLIVVAVGLAVARSAPWWTVAGLVVGVVVAFATAGLGPVVALTQAPLAAALITLVVWSERAERQAVAPDRAGVQAVG